MKAKIPAVSPADLHDLFTYDAVTGELRHARNKTRGVKAGDLAGTIHSTGYSRVTVLGRPVLAHRIIWAMVYGYWPVGIIDHRNGAKLDNRLANLREGTHRQNRANSPKVKGCRFRKGRWYAEAYIRRKYHSLGVYDTEAEARAAFVAFKAKLVGDEWVPA